MPRPGPASDPNALEAYRRIGQRMRWARELMYDSQQDFARVMGLSATTLAKVELGQRSLSVLSLMTAGEKLRTGTDFLLQGDLRLVNSPLRHFLIERHPELLSAHEAAFGPLPVSLQFPGRPQSTPRKRGGTDKARPEPTPSTAPGDDSLPSGQQGSDQAA